MIDVLLSAVAELDEQGRIDYSLAEVLKAIETVAPTEASVLITGETGTGKELVAQAIHVLEVQRQRRAT